MRGVNKKSPGLKQENATRILHHMWYSGGTQAIFSGSGGRRPTRRLLVDMVKQAQARVFVSIEAQKTLFQDVHQRRDVEACGVLIGSMDQQGNWYIKQSHPLRNIFDSPVYFEFAPEELMTADLTYPGQIVGVYHSHPTGFAAASSTDRRNMQHVNVEQEIPWVWLIVRGPFHDTPSPPREAHIPRLSILAYYHYAQEGLRRVIVEFEEAVEMTSHGTL